MLRLAALFLATAAAFAAFADASASAVHSSSTPNNGTSKVMVHIPFQASQPDGFNHVLSEFGISSFETGARSLAEYVYYVNDTLCQPITPESKTFPANATATYWKSPFILLVNAGGPCSSVMVTRHAQQMGASALLIGASKVTDSTPNLVDDGSGSDISIPTFFIFLPLADTLRAKLVGSQACLVELQWGLPVEESKKVVPPQIHFWTTAHDPLVPLESYTELRSVVKALKDFSDFSPAYSIIDGKRFSCNTQPDDNAPCDHLCTNHGRYCTLHAKDLPGRAIVKETLRRLCLWKHFDHESYWNYVIYHKQECTDDPKKYDDAKCIAQALKIAKVNAKTLDQCMSDAGELDQDVTNALLDDMVTSQSKTGVVSLPAVTIDNKVMKTYGGGAAHTVFREICAEFWVSDIAKIPRICEQCSSCPNVIGCVEANGKCVDFDNKQRHPAPYGRPPPKRGHGWKIFFTLLIVSAMFGFAWQNYDAIRERVVHVTGGGNDRARPVLNDYMNLSTGD